MTQTRRRVLQAVAGTTLGGAGAWALSRRSTATEFDTIHVGTQSGYNTIQAGVDAATPGDLVLVHEGTYPERVDVTTPRTFVFR